MPGSARGTTGTFVVLLAHAVLYGVLFSTPGCIARDSSPFVRQTDDDAGPKGPTLVDGGVPSEPGPLQPPDPHALLNIDPPHGAFTGGQRAIVRGNGFTSEARLWFGETEVRAIDLVPIDPGRLQVIVPPGSAGPVDLMSQNGDDESTRSTLENGYFYNAFYADPATGPTSGGTFITLHGDGTEWSEDTEVFVGSEACQEVEYVSETELVCQTPPGTPGAKRLRTSFDGEHLDVLDAFTYGDSDNGFRGGLSGGPLEGSLRVIALNDLTGGVIPGATVIAGVGDGALVERTNASGVALIQGAELGPRQTVTVAMKCFQPITFVGVPVDVVTAYLDPVLSPACAALGDPPAVGGGGGLGSSIEGELLWPGRQEFDRSGWSNVPAPKNDNEKLVAYVFRFNNDPDGRFVLPSPTRAITPLSFGQVGFGFFMGSSPGNFALYALAGLENRQHNPPTFSAYSMGVTRGVTVEPGATVEDVFIAIDIPLDHALSLSVQAPVPGPRGPDRAQAHVAVRVDDFGYALLPSGYQSRLLPAADPLEFVGIPPLTKQLLGAHYVVSARAVTGESAGTPLSVARVLATSTDSPLAAKEFVAIPALVQPAQNGAFDGRALEVAFGPGGTPIHLTLIDIQTAGGLSTWRVVSPGQAAQIELPDLAAVDPELGLVEGPIAISVSAALIDDFDYGSLRLRELTRAGWNAYSRDVFFARHQR